MACNSLNGIVKSCSNNQGGIYSVYINDTDNVASTTVDVTAHTITAISATTDFTAFEFSRNVGSVTVEPQIDLVNGSTFYQATVTLVFHRREAAKSRALQILGEGQRYLDMIFLDANGEYWYLDHCQLNGGAEETGTARADGSKYTVTFLAEMANRPYNLNGSVVSTVI
jgi:hypothetical protein